MVAGVDLGFYGAIAIIGEDGKELFATEMPIIKIKKLKGGYKTVLDIDLIRKILSDNASSTFFIEKTVPIPTFLGGAKFSNVQANWNQGYAEGVFEGLFTVLSIKREYVLPKAWQSHYMISSKNGDTKMQSFIHASKLFPLSSLRTEKGRLKDGVCDALLIAEWGRRRTQNK